MNPYPPNTLFGPPVNPYLAYPLTAPNGAPSAFINQSESNNPVEHYETDYYAGNEVCLFLGNMWITEVTSIQFQMNQNKTPFWGYKSQKYDAVAKGNKLVQGVFSLNYTDNNYLNMIIAYYLSKDTSSHTNLDVTANDINSFISQIQNNAGQIDLSTLNYTVSGTPVTNANFATLPFETKANYLEQMFWGANNNVKAGGNRAVTISVDNLPKFDITITYGGYATRQFGASDEFPSSHTSRVITDVEITNYQQMMATTGEPVQEIYTFLARDIETPITRPSVALLTPAGTGLRSE